ncbi:hypothetical protein [Piscinibacter sp. HJYY11]|uniref:hypothetical protein n=1 Tax=Piscinibacter sp. HJYY11 TaxID=2801333 RepID=UPI00191EA5E0|nr:hypothetical protein [Piscinibacter sp. HJYY11]MBL0727560.1 hypothetical protein [Piscinibacter sp. HJYY11]
MASASHWLDPGTIGFELLKGLPAALVALVIGTIAAWVAWQQLKVGRAKLNLDLFEQRYALFELLWAYVSARSRSADEARLAGIGLENALPKFYFLFGPQIGDYVSSVLAQGRPEEGPVGTARSQRPEAPQWFHEQAQGLHDRFAAYFDFQHWR